MSASMGRQSKIDRIVKEVFVDIVRHAGLSRATFYKHFRDKYDLANWRYLDFLNTIEDDYYSPEEAEKCIRDTVTFFYRHRIAYRKLFEYNGQNSIYDSCMEHAFKAAERTSKKRERVLGAKERYVIAYHSAGMLCIIKEWLQSDDPITPDEISRIILDNRSELVKELYA